MAAWTAAGVQVTYCVVTDGDAGGFDPAVSRSEIPAIRRAEQAAAAAEVGVKDLIWLGYPDGRVQASLELRRDLARVIRLIRPQRVVCPSPDRMWDRIFASHPDHLAAGEATVCAVYPDARNPFAFPELADEGLEPHTVAEVWLMATSDVNVYVDVTDTFDAKLAALRAHVSQETDRAGQLEARLRGWLAAERHPGGLGGRQAGGSLPPHRDRLARASNRAGRGRPGRVWVAGNQPPAPRKRARAEIARP